MKCNFSRIENREGGLIRSGNNLVAHYDKFRYLGSVVELIGGLDLDMTNRMVARWAKCRHASKVLYDRRVLLCLKGRFYKTAGNSAMLYGVKC